MALPAFTFVFTFMPLLLSRLKLVSTTRDSCLGAPHGAARPYFLFHIHAGSPFSLQLSERFFQPPLQNALNCPRLRSRPLPSFSRSYRSPFSVSKRLFPGVF